MDERRVIAQYPAVGDYWTDMPEANPRARCRLKDGQTTSSPVSILDDNTLVYDDSAVEIDTYQGDQYADVRREGEERHGTSK